MNSYQERAITCSDGQVLAARWFPARGDVRGSVLIAPAMGVVQSYYAALADWLAGQGWHVLSFDYRGIGRSRQGSLRGFQADVLDWARLDCAAAIDAAALLAPERPLVWLGHSLGGQIFPFVGNGERVDKLVIIATGSGYWRDNAAPLRRYVWWLWYVVVPLALPLCGFFPGRRLRKIGDLPRGAMAQWRRWCLHPQYAVGVEGQWAREAFARVRQPLRSFSFSDDEYMSEHSIAALHGFYVNAPKRHERLEPQALGLRRIGHFGFFRADLGATLWPDRLLPALTG